MGNELARLDKAVQMLAEAKSLDEVLKIKDIAEAAKTYARAARLGLDAQNHAAEVCLIAKRRAGEFLGQLDKDKGGRPENNSTMHGRVISEFADAIQGAGITPQDATRWQQIAKVPEEKMMAFIEETKAAGAELTTAGVLSIGKNTHVANNSGENEWYTPPQYIAAAIAVMGEIDIDPASSEIANKTVKAKKFYTAKTNGLDKEWKGKAWMNPPYASDLINKFIDKYTNHVSENDITEGIVFVNNATETNWFNKLVLASSAIVFPSSRVKFLDPNGNPGAPLQGQALLYAGDNPDKFLKSFLTFGWGAKL